MYSISANFNHIVDIDIISKNSVKIVLSILVHKGIFGKWKIKNYTLYMFYVLNLKQINVSLAIIKFVTDTRML